MKRIAVIGGGIFGCETALQLAADGNEVVLYERHDGILLGATTNSQNRLHLGLHYPRDLMTAKQSALGFSLFRDRFPTAIRSQFPNVYAVAKSGSKVTAEEFQRFAQAANIALSVCPPSLLSELGLDSSQIQESWLCDEAVIDFEVLRDILSSEIHQSNNLRLHLLEEVVSINRGSRGWQLTSRSLKSSLPENSNSEDFDVIVRATYSSDSIQSDAISARPIEYQQTMVGIAKSDISAFGLTIVDGDFLTILPRGFSNDYLVYAPSISVAGRQIGGHVPESWFTADQSRQKKFMAEIALRIAQWVPNWNFMLTGEVFQTVRTIDPSVSQSDRRTSSIREVDGTYFEVWSGKIDHAIEMAQHIRLAIR